jgi:hypothetical protein
MKATVYSSRSRHPLASGDDIVSVGDHVVVSRSYGDALSGRVGKVERDRSGITITFVSIYGDQMTFIDRFPYMRDEEVCVIRS